MVSLNENIAGVWELHPVVERSTLRRSVVNFQGTSFDSAASLRPPLSDVALYHDFNPTWRSLWAKGPVHTSLGQRPRSSAHTNPERQWRDSSVRHRS